MRKKECVAMLLAGGQGSRLGALTRRIAKPAVSFGGKYRIIDFSLSNCSSSGIDTVGVLTQYKPLILNSYIGTGESWDLDSPDGGVHVLPPYATETGGQWYAGTADAIYQNRDFIAQYNPEYVLILSGDHLYQMDYSKMLDFHKAHNADLTISVMEVPWAEASRFGIMTTNDEQRIVQFAEKPAKPESNLASMGIYIFRWDVLDAALQADHVDPHSAKDFGKNVIPALLAQGKRLFGYTFSGYWKDVGTIDSYYTAQLELLDPEPPFNIFDSKLHIFSNANLHAPHVVGSKAMIEDSLACNGCTILGTVKTSVISSDCYVGPDAIVDHSILLPGARVEAGAWVNRAIIGEGAIVRAGARVGAKAGDISVIGDTEIIETEASV